MIGAVLRQFLGKRAQGDAQDWLRQGTALQAAGKHAEAARVFEQRLQSEACDASALQGLAAALLAQGHAREGLTRLRQAVAVSPQDTALHATLGLVHAALGEPREAIESLQRAIALRPDLHDSRAQLVDLLKATERYDEAEDCCRAGLAAGAPNALRHALAGVLFEQGRVPEAIVELRAALAIDPDSAALESDLLRALNYVDDQEPETVFRAHCDWAKRHANGLARTLPVHANDPTPGRRLRIGYVSPYFRKHAVTFFLESVIEHHDSTAFEIVLYADVARPDAYSERLKSHGARWRSTVGSSDEALARLVRDDEVDILVDLSGHTPFNRLLAFARRPAPVQVTWNGYPNTTGMSAMDYRLTDARADPPGVTDPLHSERLIRLPGIYMSWRPPQDAPEPGPLPALDAGHVTFGSFNSCFKITDTTIALWSDVLRVVPRSRLLILTVTGERATARIRRAFEARGIGPERVDIRPRVPHEAFLALHREVDIALDTFPYHGTTTTCFSLWMGVPVLTLVGATHVSRVGLTLLTSIGLPELAVTDASNYVANATRYAARLDQLSALRGGLRERIVHSVLTDGRACARSLEQAYREMWLTWCAGGRPTAGS